MSSPRKDVASNRPADSGFDPTRYRDGVADSEAGDTKTSRRDRILDAASAAFNDSGYDSVRVDDIAIAAGCNKQLIYYYFKSKAQLYDAVLERMWVGMDETWSTLGTDGFRNAVLWLLKTHPPGEYAWRRLLGWEGMAQKDSREVHKESRRRLVYLRWVDLLRRAQANGDLDPRLDPEMFLLMLMFSHNGTVVLPQVAALSTGMFPSDEQFRERQLRFAETLLDLLRPRHDNGSPRVEDSPSH
jgi:TetR/AcrR family transcriptional regulator